MFTLIYMSTFSSVPQNPSFDEGALKDFLTNNCEKVNILDEFWKIVEIEQNSNHYMNLCAPSMGVN